MITETGQVIAVGHDGVWVETLKQSSCAQCAAKAGCGQKLVAEKLPGANMTFIKACFKPSDSDANWRVGDTAILGIEESALVKAALIVYLIPLFFMILFTFIASTFALAEWAIILIGLSGFIFGGLIVKSHAIKNKKNSLYQPVVLSKSIISIH